MHRHSTTWPLTILATSTLLAAGVCLAGPIEPADTLAQFELDRGLEIELVACEPAVVDPVAIRFDEDGRMWVVEMRDYPHGPPDGQAPRSKIRVLTDDDGDGTFETSRVFADELLCPTWLQPWNGGVIVTLAGEVAYMKDIDGDGRADVHETWYRGFAEENPQLRANHPRFAYDNRVYVANGLRGGTVVDPRRKAAKPVPISGRDFAFDPRTGDCQAVSGNGQFGLTFDAWGNRFVCSNRRPVDHVVLANHYLARNPFLASANVLSPVAAGGAESHVYPLTSAWTTSNLHAGQFTAACGVTIYNDVVLGRDYAGNAFVCEPTGSLVHREVLTADGVSFTSESPYEGREFLASRDDWFRPVNLTVGPDGALYVVDMYRAVIEHPQFMPSELQQRPDLRLGDDRGRIYRVVPTDGPSNRSPPRMSGASSEELVEALGSPSGWWRETAARLLYERQDHGAVPRLEQALTQGGPLQRAAALWALSGMDALSAELVRKALADDNARVREQAVVLAEPLLGEDAEIKARFLKMADAAAPRIRYRVALALGGLAGDEVVAPLTRIALTSPDDEWMRRGVLTSLPVHTAPILREVLRSPQVQQAECDAPEQVLVEELAAIVGSRGEAREVGPLLDLLTKGSEASSAAYHTALVGLADGIARRGGSLLSMVADFPDGDRIRTQLESTFARATTTALDENAEARTRGDAFALLRHDRGENVVNACLRILEASPSHGARVAAADVLARQSDERIAPSLLRLYPEQMPTVQRAILDALIADADSAGQLLLAIQQGKIRPAELDAARQQRLRQHRDATLRELAAKVLAAGVSADRQVVLKEYRAALEMKADRAAGKQLFKQHCATCHRIDDVGVNVAPDISDSRAKTPEQLLTDILHPNKAIDNNYVSYTVATIDGNVHTGIIAAETDSAITLRQPEDKTVALLRADIESIRSGGVSLMPEGFEKHLSKQQMADLLGFIKNWRYPAGGIPATIAPGDEKSGS